MMNNAINRQRYVRSDEVNMLLYERLPTPIQGALRNSLWVTLFTSSLYLLFYLVAPPHSLHYATGGFFLVDPLRDFFNFAVSIYQSVGEFLLWANGLSWLLSLLVLGVSRGLTRPVSEIFHWVVGVNALPAGVSVMFTALCVAIAAVAIVLNIVLVLLLGMLAIAMFIGMLNSGSRR